MPKRNLFGIIEDDNKKYEIEYRMHATRRMFQRDIFEDDVEQIVWEGDIIESYEDDFPLPSFLINGISSTGRPIHVVAAINNIEKIIVIITNSVLSIVPPTKGQAVSLMLQLIKQRKTAMQRAGLLIKCC